MRYFFVFCMGWLLFGCQEKPIQKPRQVEISGQQWYVDIEKARNLAQKEHKNLLVMVSEDYCRWCIKMEEETLTQSAIQTKLQQYVLVSLKRSDTKSLRHIDGFDGNIPSFFFIEPQSNFSESIIGYYASESFLEYLIEIEEDNR